MPQLAFELNSIDQLFLKKRVEILQDDYSFVIREVTALARLSHPRIVRYNNAWEELITLDPEDSDESYASDTPTAFLFIQMEFCGKRTLSEAMREGYFERKSQEAFRSFSQIVNGMQYVHEEAHLIHRDLKPSNIFCIPLSFRAWISHDFRWNILLGLRLFLA